MVEFWLFNWVRFAIVYKSLLYHVRLALFEFDAISVFFTSRRYVLPVLLCLHTNLA